MRSTCRKAERFSRMDELRMRTYSDYPSVSKADSFPDKGSSRIMPTSTSPYTGEARTLRPKGLPPDVGALGSVPPDKGSQEALALPV